VTPRRTASLDELRPQDIVRDDDTIAYFDDHVPEYSVERLELAAKLINERKGEDSALVDIGCGAGNTLHYLRQETGIERLCGIDVSANLLERTRERVQAETHLGSILDRELVEHLACRFDFAVVAAVLHHLIGKSRKQSRQYAALAVRNSLDLLRPGGHLIIMEPVFGPPLAMDTVFWVKKGLTRLTSRRVSLFGHWNNLGPPVVSYYTPEDLLAMVRAADGAELTDTLVEEQPLPGGVRMVLSRADATILARRA